MKTMLRPVALAGLCAVFLFSGFAQTSSQPEPKFSWVPADDPTGSLLRQSGERAINRIGGSLVNEVERALATVGLDESMDVMHLKKLAVPAPVPGKPSLTEFKLTSYRVRNPRNAPDPADLAALDHVRTKLRDDDGTANQPFLQKIERPGQPDEWRIYRAFVITPKCLLCHGNTDSLQPQIRAALNRRFPEDQAVDYQPYDWRGLIRVSYVVPPAQASN